MQFTLSSAVVLILVIQDDQFLHFLSLTGLQKVSELLLALKCFAFEVLTAQASLENKYAMLPGLG